MFILVVFAFLAGIVTILSPCILPVLPIVLSSIYCQFYLFYSFSFNHSQDKRRIIFRFTDDFCFCDCWIWYLTSRSQVSNNNRKNILQIIRFSSPKQYPIRICPGSINWIFTGTALDAMCWSHSRFGHISCNHWNCDI